MSSSTFLYYYSILKALLWKFLFLYKVFVFVENISKQNACRCEQPFTVTGISDIPHSYLKEFLPKRISTVRHFYNIRHFIISGIFHFPAGPPGKASDNVVPGLVRL